MNKSYIPNIFTFINLAFGVMSIMMTMEGNYLFAGLLVLAAGIVDRYDGRIARILKAESLIGKELDSLADNVSFGVAPALLIYTMFNLKEYVIIGLAATLIYCIAGCYRLARYNSANFTGSFSGVPITISGTALSVISLAFIQNYTEISSVIMLIIMLLFAYLMVSDIQIKKF